MFSFLKLTFGGFAATNGGSHKYRGNSPTKDYEMVGMDRDDNYHSSSHVEYNGNGNGNGNRISRGQYDIPSGKENQHPEEGRIGGLGGSTSIGNTTNVKQFKMEDFLQTFGVLNRKVF